MSADPVQLLFGGMKKLGPGCEKETVRALRSLPRGEFDTVVDAGCGSGQQTLVLARELNSLVHAVDNHQPFLTTLMENAAQKNIEHLVKTHCLDMQSLPKEFSQVDLLWCEGAVYNIGFENALKTWRPMLAKHGFLVLSELCWLREANIPADVFEFFKEGYPDMRNVPQVASIIENAGYDLLSQATLPASAWVEGYYDVLRPKAIVLSNHDDDNVREFATSTLQEIEIFENSEDCYGYVINVLQVK